MKLLYMILKQVAKYRDLLPCHADAAPNMGHALRSYIMWLQTHWPSDCPISYDELENRNRQWKIVLPLRHRTTCPIQKISRRPGASVTTASVHRTAGQQVERTILHRGVIHKKINISQGCPRPSARSWPKTNHFILFCHFLFFL